MPRIGRARWTTALALALLATPAGAAAQPGTLDPTFSGGMAVVPGAVRTPGLAARPVALARQPDGKLVLAGSGFEAGGTFVLVRLNADGSPDTGFGSGGRTSTRVSAIAESDFDPSGAFAVALQPDGRIVAAGVGTVATDRGARSRLAVARYNQDGSLDGSFGSGGVAMTALADGAASDLQAEGHALVLQPDGRIVVAGSSDAPGCGGCGGLARFNPDGTLDGGFGSGGRVQLDTREGDTVFNAAVLEPGGRIALAGGAGGTQQFLLARYEPSGAPDSSFGGTGTGWRLDEVGTDQATAHGLALQPDGKLLVGGVAELIPQGVGRGSCLECFALARYTASGVLDRSFGRRGRVVTAVGPAGRAVDAAAYDVAVQPDGKVLAAGGALVSRPAPQAAVLRYSARGALDTGWGANGAARYRLPDRTGDVRPGAFGIALQPDGRALIGGATPFHGEGRLFAARLESGDAPDEARPGLGFVRVQDRQRIRQMLRRGYLCLFGVDEAARVECRVSMDSRLLARQVQIGRRGTRTSSRRDDVLLRVKPARAARRALRGLRRVRLLVRVSAVDAAGNRSSTRQRVTLRR
jgi:uncharacterized delta-60 repeat protein